METVDKILITILLSVLVIMFIVFLFENVSALQNQGEIGPMGPTGHIGEQGADGVLGVTTSFTSSGVTGPASSLVAQNLSIEYPNPLDLVLTGFIGGGHVQFFNPELTGWQTIENNFANGVYAKHTTQDPPQITKYGNISFNIPVSEYFKVEVKDLAGASFTSAYRIIVSINADVATQNLNPVNYGVVGFFGNGLVPTDKPALKFQGAGYAGQANTITSQNLSNNNIIISQTAEKFGVSGGAGVGYAGIAGIAGGVIGVGGSSTGEFKIVELNYEYKVILI